MQNLTNQLPIIFIDIKKVKKSYILAMNAPTHIDVLEGYLTNDSKMCLKCGRPLGSKDSTPSRDV